MGTKTAKPSKQPTAKPGKGKPPAPGGADAPTPPAAPQPAGLVAPALPPVEYRGTLPLGRLRPSPTNPRKTLDPASVAELAASIGSLGLLQPLLVRPVGPAPKMGPKGWEGVDHFEVIAGERRFRALDLNGAAEAAVTCRLLTDAEVAWVQLVENDQREDVRPSERAAAYAAIAAAGQTAEQIAAATGVALSAVRDLVRLARLPAWALAAVDRGVLPVATAALVAKVPGEQARARAACEVLLDVALLAGDDADDFARKGLRGPDPVPMSYRDAKRHLQEYYTRQLKGSPFSLKMADLLPDAGSCDACPKRAGNDPEAKAEGVRADVCLDPDCYREKVEAHDAAELARGAKKGLLSAGDDFAWPGEWDQVPRGWCDVTYTASLTELGEDLRGTRHAGRKLADILAFDCDHSAGAPPVYGVLDPKHKLRSLIRTEVARRLLRTAGILKRPDPKPKAEKAAPSPAKPSRPLDAGEEKSHAAGLSSFDVDSRALLIAARVVEECGEDQFSQLAELSDSGTDPAEIALRLVARAAAYDFCLSAGSMNRPVLAAVFPDAEKWIKDPAAATAALAAIDTWPAARCLAFLLRIAVGTELFEGPNTDTGRALFAFAELDWPQLLDQAGRELAGGPTADERIAAAEAADAGKAGAA